MILRDLSSDFWSLMQNSELYLAQEIVPLQCILRNQPVENRDTGAELGGPGSAFSIAQIFCLTRNKFQS